MEAKWNNGMTLQVVARGLMVTHGAKMPIVAVLFHVQLDDTIGFPSLHSKEDQPTS